MTAQLVSSTNSANPGDSDSAWMHPSQRSLALLMAVGGLAVLGTYAWGFIGQTESMNALWGGVPESLRPLYTINMFLAAGGFFLFAPYILLGIRPGEGIVAGRFGYGIFHLLFTLVLIPSALWLPLTFVMVESPSHALWWLIRADLALVGLGAIGLFSAICALEGPRTRARIAALIGLLPFILQTAVLDALVWPAYFPIAPSP